MGIEIRTISDSSDIDKDKWNHFVVSHPNGNFYQSPKAFQFYRKVENYQPLLFIALEDDEIIGSLLAVFIQEYSSLKKFFSKRCIVWGGPLVLLDKIEIIPEILEKLNKIASKRAIYSQFRNFFDTKEIKKYLMMYNWKYEEHLNILIDLTKSEDGLWREVHKTRRKHIRRAERQGVEFAALKDKGDIPATYEILKEVYRRVKLPLPSQAFFETAFDELGTDNFKIFNALYKNKIIGTRYTLCYCDTIHDWYAGSYQQAYDKYPNDLIPWKVFLWGKENGYKKFDFGGAGKPGINYGVRDYKKKFGGELVNYGRYEKVHKPYLFQVAKSGFKIYQKIKK